MAASNKETVAELLTRLIDYAISKDLFTQVELARELGYPKPNIITMFKQGKTRLPLNKVGAMAKALKIDRAYLFKLTLSEYHPDTYESLADLLDSLLLTENEAHILRKIRSLSDNCDPELATDSENEMLAQLVDAMVARKRDEADMQNQEIEKERKRKSDRVEAARQEALGK